MTETITRLFDTPALARQAAGELERVGVLREAISIIAPGPELHGRDALLAALTRAGIDPQEAQPLAEAVHRGGAVIRVNVAQDRLAEACAALDSVPFITLQPKRASYQISGTSPAADDATPPDEQAISHDRAR
ncbi:hypothetical protein [Novosphingobium rosa]|uniref:hypothetical protein n=1 Tax=Novosphingobium rosa TaxID=76978 RepID=UPI000835D8CE|nr:hypothetical protein [Novosphingobium rosa]